jgi:hypothetical protein
MAGSDPVPNLYQPFRPPPSIAPVEEAVHGSKEEMLQRLTERMGLWHEWAPLITLLQRQGISPSEIDEATGLTGVEQNRTVVGAQVRRFALIENMGNVSCNLGSIRARKGLIVSMALRFACFTFKSVMVRVFKGFCKLRELK